MEAVGTPQSRETSIAIVRDGGQVGAVGVPHTAPTIPTMPLLGRNLGVRAGIAPVRTYVPDLLRRVLEEGLDPSPVFDLTLPLGPDPAGLCGDGPAHRDQGRPAAVIRCSPDALPALACPSER